MVLSDKKFIEFADRIWERNKELIEENRALKQDILQYVDRINKLKDELEFEKAFSRDSHSQNIKLRKDLEEVNARCNEVMDKQYERIRELERKRVDCECEYEDLDDRERELKIFINPENGHFAVKDCDEFEDISDDWDDLFEDDLGPSDRFINCTFNLNF